MRTRSSAVSLVAFGLFGLTALSARSAFADSQCASDADCVKGWQCQVTGESGCASACAPGQDCSQVPPCQTEEYKSCVPGPCKADSDCADGMVCYTTTNGCVTTTPACPPGATCAQPADSCAPSTTSQCLPKYDVPCTADKDCGDGFTCVPDVCACASAGSGSSDGSNGATPAMDGGAAPSDPSNPPVTCSCPATTTSRCQAVAKDCTTDKDCPSSWTCETIGGDTCVDAPPTPAPEPNGGAGNNSAPADKADAAPCQPAPAIHQCMPPYYTLGGGSYVSGGGTAVEGTGAPTGAGSVNTGNSGSAGSAAGTTPPKASNGDTSSDANSSTSGGCSVAQGVGAGSSAGGLGLLLLGLFGVTRRRRAAAK